MKACRVSQESHPVAVAAALTCKKCHAGKCFPHLLDNRIHSMRAFLLQEQDNSHAVYHKEHASKFPEYPARMQTLLIAQGEGKPCAEFNALMVFNSSTFRVCQPVNEVHAKMGWYDKNVPKQKRIVSEHPASEVKESQKKFTARKTTYSSASPQASAKNHAYVEVKPVNHPASPTATSDRSPSSSLSSISHEDNDSFDLVCRLLHAPTIPDILFHSVIPAKNP